MSNLRDKLVFNSQENITGCIKKLYWIFCLISMAIQGNMLRARVVLRVSVKFRQKLWKRFNITSITLGLPNFKCNIVFLKYWKELKTIYDVQNLTNVFLLRRCLRKKMTQTQTEWSQIYIFFSISISSLGNIFLTRMCF